MRQRYNIERCLPVVIDVTLEELRLIDKLAKAVLALETMPDGLWKTEVLELCNSVQDVVQEASRSAAQHFAGTAEND